MAEPFFAKREYYQLRLATAIARALQNATMLFIRYSLRHRQWCYQLRTQSGNTGHFWLLPQQMLVLYTFGSYRTVMHPPAFRPTHHLSDWPECRLELNCCRSQVVIPVKLLMRQHGDPTFATVLVRLRCQRCKAAPAPVYLCAGSRELAGGAPPDWAIELVPKRR